MRAQPVISARSLSLGGTGTAHIGGPEATFWNPANLMIPGRSASFHLTVGSGALFSEPVLPHSSIKKQLVSFGDAYIPFQPESAAINAQQKRAIIANHYPDNKQLSTHRQRADALLAGVAWQKDAYALSIALRARYASTTRSGRGWYDSHYSADNGELVRNFTLTQRRTELYEVAVGFAQELTYLNGLLPGPGKFSVGITPKLIAAGAQMDASFEARYLGTKTDIQPLYNTFVSEFNLQGSGSRSRVVSDYRQSRNPQQAVTGNLNKNYAFKPAGIGLGFDFGLSYFFPLEPALINAAGSEKTGKSLRIAFSLNDIGAIRYYDNPLVIQSVKDTVGAMYQPAAGQMFTGAGGQYVHYLHQAGSLPNPLLSGGEPSDENYTASLPASVNAGAMLDLDRVKFTAGLSLGLQNTAFTSNNLIVQLGMEARPFAPFPIRIGTTLAREQPFQIGFGTGVETANWDFTLGSRLHFLPDSPAAAFSGGAWGGFQFHF